MYISPERLMLTENGQVVREGDPRAKRLLVAKGGEISREEALKYGLVADPQSLTLKLPGSDQALSLEEVSREPTPGEKAAAEIARSVPQNIGGSNQASQVPTGPAMDAPPKDVNAPPAPSPQVPQPTSAAAPTPPPATTAPAKTVTAAPQGTVPTAPLPTPPPAASKTDGK